MKRAKSENDNGDDNNDDINLIMRSQQQQPPYISGAYIRTFVNQLASSRSMRESSTTAVAEQDPLMAISKPKKKQVRRRLQTRKPYQEKMLNMAEARREIVTALKLHRAAMKEQQQQQQQTEQKSKRNPRIFASNNTNDVVPHPPYINSSWPIPTAVPPPPPPPPVFLDFALPSQPLGLNLNLHDFMTSPISIYSTSSPSTSSSPPPPSTERAEGFEFLECEGEEEREEEVVSSPFDEVMEFPPWLNANESCLLQHVDDQDFFQASVLPCMEIEEIEGIDGEWLA